MKAFDSRAKPWIIEEKRSLETNCWSSILFVNIARTTKAPQKEETFVMASPSVHVKASKHICSAGRARPWCFKMKL
jgi:putative IMPACT (imprinted ancient) family translation regulator